jgi:hypothetical protein
MAKKWEVNLSGERKSVYLNFRHPQSVAVVADMIRSAMTRVPKNDIVVSEMLPTPE